MNCFNTNTKGVTDVPITAQEIVEQGYLSQEEWVHISRKSIRII